MSVEATSALTFRSLILEVARAMGVSYYGENGDEETQIPVDPNDLAECKRHVNNGIRMFLSDAPPTGWRWARPVADVSLWPVVVVSTETVTGGTYASADDETTLTATDDTFYESMEEHSIVLTVAGTFVMKRYVSATQMVVYGNASAAATDTFAIAADGNYTLPRTFAGSFTGGISFGPATNRAVQIEWVNESTIRALRENVNVDIGIPRYLAVDVIQVANSKRRRYRLMAYPTPYQLHVVQFPYDLHFDLLTDLDEVPPTPIAHDETIRAATLAVVERDVNGEEGLNVSYYKQSALINSMNIDARSGPRKLGYFGNQRNTVTPLNFRDFVKRQNVVFNTP